MQHLCTGFIKVTIFNLQPVNQLELCNTQWKLQLVGGGVSSPVVSGAAGLIYGLYPGSGTGLRVT